MIIEMRKRKTKDKVPTTHRFEPFTFLPTADSDALIVEGIETDPMKIREYIHRRRRQMIVHSVIYYRMDENVIPDTLWQEWANQLAAVQNNYPQYTDLGFHDELFVDWDGSTGMHLDLPEYYGVALSIIRMAQSY
ncbi:putative DNA ligase [Salmonella phage pSal-SNUABM-04]|nr:putative DNA ligase [Salmonella phage pSal-SNUABM-04]